MKETRTRHRRGNEDFDKASDEEIQNALWVRDRVGKQLNRLFVDLNAKQLRRLGRIPAKPAGSDRVREDFLGTLLLLYYHEEQLEKTRTEYNRIVDRINRGEEEMSDEEAAAGLGALFG